MTNYPTSNDEVAAILRDQDRPLHISGNSSSDESVDILSLSKLNAVLLYEPEEMIITVQSGLPLSEITQSLAKHGQWIPTLVAAENIETTLGAAVAMDHFHPRSLPLGALRTTILGGTFCTTAGEIFKSGSRVVKSVAGYDIHRAFCRSKGLFGVILDLTLKVQARPERFFRFRTSLNNREAILPFHPKCLEESRHSLLVELAGYHEDVTFDMTTLSNSGIGIDELGEQAWISELKDVIVAQDQLTSTLSEATEHEMLQQVRRVFDPKQILV